MTQPAGPAGSGKIPGVGKTAFTMEEVAWTAYQYWGKGFAGNVTTAIATAIAWAESTGNINAHNNKPPDDSYGLWQINMIGSLGPRRRAKYNLTKNEDLFSPTTNARVAYGESASGNNWRPWSTYTDGSYKKFMPQALKAVENRKQPGNVGGGPEQTEYEGINALLNPLFDFFKEAGLRTAGFVGGAALIIGAIVLVAKRS